MSSTDPRARKAYLRSPGRCSSRAASRRVGELAPLSHGTVGVAQRLAAAVVATLVATIAQPVVCVPPAVGAARRTGGRQGRLSGPCGGYLVLVELQ